MAAITRKYGFYDFSNIEMRAASEKLLCPGGGNNLVLFCEVTQVIATDGLFPLCLIYHPGEYLSTNFTLWARAYTAQMFCWNHRYLDCLLNHLFRCISKKVSKFRVTGLCEGNPPVISGFPSQRVSNSEMFLYNDVIMIRPKLSHGLVTWSYFVFNYSFMT